MDSAKQSELEQLLAEAERHVFEGECLLERQRKLLERYRRHGHDPQLFCELLAAMEDTHRLHVAQRDRLRREREESANSDR